MSGSIGLKFSKEEAENLRAFIKDVPQEELGGPWVPGFSSYGCWLNFTRGTQLWIEHPSGELDGEWAKAVAVALAKVAEVEKVDWSSGWENAEKLPETFPFRLELKRYEEKGFTGFLYTDSAANDLVWMKITSALMTEAADSLVKQFWGKK